MGGSRFQHLGPIVRLERNEHDQLAADVIKALSGIGIDARVIPHLRSKSSFGDIDLLASRLSVEAATDEGISRTIGATAFDRGPRQNPTLHLLLAVNGGSAQIDLVSVDSEMLDFVASQLAWGDAGTFAAVIARNMGLKLGMHGISLTDEDHRGQVRATIDLTHAEALELLGLSAERHAAGFDAQEDVFAWIAAGKYFDPTIFQIERLTNGARRRAGVRPGYQAFLAWIADNRPPSRYCWGERGSKVEEWRRRLFAMFPESAAEIARKRAEARRKDDLARLFNGETVMAITGITDPKLQHLMNAIRKQIAPDRLLAMAQNGDHDDFARQVRKIALSEYLPTNF